MASSRDCVVFWLFLVLFSATTGALPAPAPIIIPFKAFNDKEFQFVGRFAVDEYNDMHMGEPHLFISLKRVVGGEAILYELSKEQTTWNIKLTARNYSRRQLGPLAYYTATVFENMNNISGGQSLAYGSNLNFGGLSSSMWSNDLLKDYDYVY